MKRTFPLEIMVAPQTDEHRVLRVLEHKAKLMRLSDDTRIATTAAKWERHIHEALQAVLGAQKTSRKEVKGNDQARHEA